VRTHAPVVRFRNALGPGDPRKKKKKKSKTVGEEKRKQTHKNPLTSCAADDAVAEPAGSRTSQNACKRTRTCTAAVGVSCERQIAFSERNIPVGWRAGGRVVKTRKTKLENRTRPDANARSSTLVSHGRQASFPSWLARRARTYNLVCTDSTGIRLMVYARVFDDGVLKVGRDGGDDETRV